MKLTTKWYKQFVIKKRVTLLTICSSSFLYLSFQVECKKAQPKEVMMPNNVTRGRTAGKHIRMAFYDKHN